MAEAMLRLKQLVDRDPKCIGEPFYVVERDVAGASLDMRHECPMQIALECQVLLRPAACGAQNAQIDREHLPGALMAFTGSIL